MFYSRSIFFTQVFPKLRYIHIYSCFYLLCFKKHYLFIIYEFICSLFILLQWKNDQNNQRTARAGDSPICGKGAYSPGLGRAKGDGSRLSLSPRLRLKTNIKQNLYFFLHFCTVQSIEQFCFVLIPHDNPSCSSHSSCSYFSDLKSTSLPILFFLFPPPGCLNNLSLRFLSSVDFKQQSL